MIGVKIDSRWIGLQGPHSRISWIQNEVSADHQHQATQIQPSVRCGSVPLGAANWTMPSPKARHRREGMQRDRGSGIEQRRKGHWQRLMQRLSKRGHGSRMEREI